MNSIRFEPDKSARFADDALKKSVVALENAQQCAVLWFGEIMRRGLYRSLGYSSINQYAHVELKFSKPEPGILCSSPGNSNNCQWFAIRWKMEHWDIPRPASWSRSPPPRRKRAGSPWPGKAHGVSWNKKWPLRRNGPELIQTRGS